ncbi:short chain dehydrogenase [compost metagenome]
MAKKDVSVYAVNPGAIDTDMNKGSDWDMPDPDSTSIQILEGVSDGKLDSIPDEMGQGMYNAWREDPAKLSKLFADLYYAENAK